jgi:4-oxalocrotonate tautomerase
VREFTEVLARVLHERPEHTHVVIQKIKEEDRGFAGVLTDDCRRREGEPGT